MVVKPFVMRGPKKSHVNCQCKDFFHFFLINTYMYKCTYGVHVASLFHKNLIYIVYVFSTYVDFFSFSLINNSYTYTVYMYIFKKPDIYCKSLFTIWIFLICYYILVYKESINGNKKEKKKKKKEKKKVNQMVDAYN